MICPKCKSDQVQAVSEVNSTTKTKGFGCCKGAVGYLILGPIGWLCGLCGMGKGKTTYSSKVLWVCNNCGNRFK